MLIGKPDSESFLQGFLPGDQRSFDAIYSEYRDVLYEMACRRLHDHEQAEDVVQDVFASLWEQRSVLRITNLEAYLKGSVRNAVFNLVAREKVKDSYFTHLARLNHFSSGTDASLPVLNPAFDATAVSPMGYKVCL